MISNAVVDRYTRALFDSAKDHDLTGTIDAELEQLAKDLASEPAFYSLLTGRAITGNEKKSMLREVYSGFSPLTLNFLSVVVDKERESYLSEMINSYHELYIEAQGIVRASLTTAAKLPDEDYAEIAEKIGNEWGKKVEFTCDTDPSLLGGAVIKVGDKVIDVSLSKQFQLIKEQLLK